MEPPKFELEAWFDKYEHDAEIHLGEGHLRGLDPSRFDLSPEPLNYVIPTEGDPEFRGAVGSRYGKSKEEILFTGGTQEANLLSTLSVLDTDEHAIVILPTYKALANVAETIAEVSYVRLTPPEWEIPTGEIEDSIKESTALIILDNPNNPTGKYHPPEVMEEIYEIAASNEIFVLCDEGNRMLIKNPHPAVASLGKYGISTTSVTKPHGLAGLRFGWLAANREVTQRASKWSKNTTITPSVFGQHIARQALTELEDEILAENRELVEQNYSTVKRFVNKYNLDWYESITATGFIKSPKGFDDARSFCRKVMEQESVLLVPGDVFGYPNYFRIGLGLPTEEVERGISRVEAVIDSSD